MIVIVVTALALLLTAVMAFRNDQLDKGGIALKNDNGTLALEHLKPLAYLGDKNAQLLVAWVYACGIGGVPKSESDAEYWFAKAGPFPQTAVGTELVPERLYHFDEAGKSKCP